MKPGALGVLALLLLPLLAVPARAEGTVTLASLDSGVSVAIGDPSVAANLTERLGPAAPWINLSADNNFRRTHLIIIGSTNSCTTSTCYYYAAGTGSYAGTVIWYDRGQEKYMIDPELNAALRPYLDRLQALEGEVAFARSLQILAGIALAILVCVLLYIGMREEKKPQVLR